MHKLTFKSKDFPRMLTWMQSHYRKIPYMDETTDDYGLWLVKDQGIYLMAPAEKRDMDKDGVHVIYARGYSPKAADLWEKTHAVSGDDFAEFIPLSKEQVLRLYRHQELVINISETQLEIIA